MRRSLTSAVALVGAGIGVAAQPARTEPDAKAAEISTWRWAEGMILLSPKDSPQVLVRSAQPAAGANRRNDF